MRRRLAACFAASLALAGARDARAEEAVGAAPPTVTWQPGRIEAPVAEDAAPSGDWTGRQAGAAREAIDEIVATEKPMTEHSRGLAMVGGALAAAVYGTVGAGVLATSPRHAAVGVGFASAGVSGVGLFMGSLLSPSLDGLREEMDRAHELLPDEDLTAREMERVMARLAARERTVRKVSAAVTFAGAVGAMTAGTVAAAQRDNLGQPLLLVGAIHGAVALVDWTRPWEIEARAEAAQRRIVTLRPTAMATPGGASVGLTGSF